MRSLPEGMREKVLSAAELIADHGLDATKMEDIAAATGVPKATLYYYFEGKEDILAFLFSEILDEVSQAIDEAVQTSGNSADRMRAAVAAHLQVFDEYPAASRALQFDLGRAARLPQIRERTDAAFIEPMRKLLEEGAKDGSLRPTRHPRVAAIAVLGAITTVGINTVSAEGTRAGDVADDVIAVVLGGLST